MSLWHMDWKQLSDGRWWTAAMDDASRLIMNYGVFQTATAEHAIHVLKKAIDKHGCPRELLTDRGSQFYANEGERREKGISQFEAYLAEHGIKHLLCRVNHPQRTGNWNASTASTSRNNTNSSRWTNTCTGTTRLNHTSA
jgi:transposase InsO family protein